MFIAVLGSSFLSCKDLTSMFFFAKGFLWSLGITEGSSRLNAFLKITLITMTKTNGFLVGFSLKPLEFWKPPQETKQLLSPLSHVFFFGRRPKTGPAQDADDRKRSGLKGLAEIDMVKWPGGRAGTLREWLVGGRALLRKINVWKKTGVASSKRYDGKCQG